MSKKALIIASVSSMIEMFNMSNILLLQQLEFKVDVACDFTDTSFRNVEKIEIFKKTLNDLKINYYQIDFSRNFKNIKRHMLAYKQVKNLITENNYSIIHCHSPIGGVITRLAAKSERKSGVKVIYTAHGFHFFKGAPKLNWILFYPIEKYLSKYTDVLITINNEDYNLAKEKMKARKVEYVPGVGIDTKKFSDCSVDRTEKRKELGVPNDAFMLLSVGELNKNKNHEVIIRAVAKLNDPDMQYCIAGQGVLKEYLFDLAKELKVEKQIHLLGFRNDIIELCKAADVFCFPSKREGLPVSVMEAMACGLPVVCSKIRGNVDLIEDEKNGFLCLFEDVEGFKSGIEKLVYMEKDKLDKMTHYNSVKMQKFDIENVKKEMKRIYEEV